jgi:predicted GIY-YIG superfamily endonuclease
MNKRLKGLIDSLEPKLTQLRKAKSFRLPVGSRQIPREGLYLFSEKGKPLYVGRSYNIRRRLQLHTRDCSSYFQAFATYLAKETTGLKASYVLKKIAPEHFSNQQSFKQAFASAKKRIKKMNIQILEEADPIRQAVLEVCVALTFPTKYNDFRTH